MANQPKTPQMQVRVPEDLRAKAVYLARARGERDALGTGASVIVRRALSRYVARHEAELPDDWPDT